MFLHLGAAPPQMRARELEQPAAVVEILRFEDQQRLAEAVRAETRPAPVCRPAHRTAAAGGTAAHHPPVPTRP